MITGSIVAIVTPMKEGGLVDWDRFKNLIEIQINSGTNAIVVAGTTGESATLEPKEHIDCIKFVVDVVNKRIPVIAGTGANSTAEAIYLAVQAKLAGVDAHLSVTPYYNKPNQTGIYEHFKAIASACDLPLILYNVPGRTVSDMSVDTVLKLSEISNIVGIKEASTLERCRELLEKCPKDFAIYSGDDPINYQIISEGAAGAISVTANVAPKLMSDVCNLAKTDTVKAQAVDKKLELLNNDLFVEANPIPVKWALYKMGLIENQLRLPLVPMDDIYSDVVIKALQAADINVD